jgi:hypothetical protein
VARYYFSISRTQEMPPTWKWTIQRNNKPLLVRLEEDGFRSRKEAIAAAEKALEELLLGIAETDKEEASNRRKPGRPRSKTTAGIS